MAEFITVGSSGAFQLESQPNYSLRTTHEGGQTVYYSTSPRVSSTINDGTLTTGGQFTFTGRRFFITQSGTGTQGSSASLRLDNVPVAGESVVPDEFNARSYGSGVQSSIEAAITAAVGVGGGRVYCPGDYAMSGELTLYDYVHLVGDGPGTTVLTWANDLGTGKYAMKPQTSPAGGSAAPSLTGMSLTGPGPLTLGVRTSNMNGPQLGADVNMTDVALGQFGANIVFIGNHNVLTRVKSTSGYYNVLFDDGAVTKGNQAFYSCRLDHAAFASIAVAGSNIMDGCDLISCDLGGSPYGIYKFDGLAPSAIGLMTETTLLNTSFESAGNAAILDEGTGVTNGLDSITYCTIDNPGFTWDGTYKIAARNKNYAVNVRNCTNLVYRSGTYPFTAGDVGVFSTLATQGYKTSLTYSASITPNTSLTPVYEIIVTNGVAFAINNPTNGGIQSPITFDIRNASGGAMGAITWGGSYLLAGAFTNPANGKRRTITLYWEGGGYVELHRAAADI